MAGQRENSELTFIRCMYCETAIYGTMPDGKRLEHLADGAHRISDYRGTGERPSPRPTHRTVELWQAVRNAAEYIRTVEFYLGYLPEKPRAFDDDAVRLNLEDARAAIGELALALSEGGEL